MKAKSKLFVFLLFIGACTDANFESEKTLFERLANHLEKSGHSVKYINDSEIFISTALDMTDLTIEINRFFVSVNHPEQQFLISDEMSDRARTKDVNCTQGRWYRSGEFTCVNYLCVADLSFEVVDHYTCDQAACYSVSVSCHLTNG